MAENICSQSYGYRTQNKDFIISGTKALILIQLFVIAAVLVVFLGYPLFTKQELVTVTGILYTIENSSALIDGQIVKEGDTINGITVVKIYRTEVEFRKNGRLWKQRIGQHPGSTWKNAP